MCRGWGGYKRSIVFVGVRLMGGGGEGRGRCDILWELLYIITWTADFSNILLKWSKDLDLEFIQYDELFFTKNVSIPQNQTCLRLCINTVNDFFSCNYDSWWSSDFPGYSTLLLFQIWLRGTSPIIIIAFLCHYKKNISIFLKKIESRSCFTYEWPTNFLPITPYNQRVLFSIIITLLLRNFIRKTCDISSFCLKILRLSDWDSIFGMKKLMMGVWGQLPLRVLLSKIDSYRAQN